MKTNHINKVTETIVGAAIGAAIAGPAGAVAGGLVGNQVAAHNPYPADAKRRPKKGGQDAGDPIIHAPVKRILVPIDFSPPSRRALRFAYDWAVRFGSEVCLLHVLEPANTFGLLGTDPGTPTPAPVDFRKDIHAELERLARKEFPDSTKLSVQLRDGVPCVEIATAAREWEADLIIIATHGRTGLAHAFLGSTAEQVVRHAPCPVLTLRRAMRA